MGLTKEIKKQIVERLKAGSEQQKVVGPLVERLIELGWEFDQIIFGRNEWQVPKTPSEATKREKGHSFDFFPVDIAVFENSQTCGDYRHLLFIIECKQPDESAGLQQLETYLSLEPHAHLGIWANNADVSAESLFVYKDKSGLQYPKKKIVNDIPSIGSKIEMDEEKLTFSDLVIPTSSVLQKLFANLLDMIVSQDSQVTRREEQLDQLCNIILLKLDSDKQGRTAPKNEVKFRPLATNTATAKYIKKQFSSFANIYPDIFVSSNDSEIRFSDSTIQQSIEKISIFNFIEVGPDTVAVAFQVLRSAALKQEEGQYFTPRPVIEAAVKLMNISFDDIILDPACGTGGFLVQCLLEMRSRYPSELVEVSRWAQIHLFGIDKDAIGIKLTKAIMQILGDGSAHCVRGDSVLTHTWPIEYQHLQTNHFKNSRFTLIFTNPPFGANLKTSSKEAKKSNLSIVEHIPKGKDIELGLAMLNRCYDLLRIGGRLCIVLPETYFFSPSYRFVREWMKDRLKPLGVVNVPMEAFQGFCRAKTNIYVFEKLEEGYDDEEAGDVFFLNPKTCGIYKNGGLRFKVTSDGRRTTEIDNELLESVVGYTNDCPTCGTEKISAQEVSKNDILVPRYYDRRWNLKFEALTLELGCKPISLDELHALGVIGIMQGHGSPSNDLRVGSIPYVKVSDIRNLRVNINPTNLIPLQLAKKFWRNSDVSGIEAWDLITPNRASSNIGEFAVFLPGEERVVVTKEVFIFRVMPDNILGIDSFYLLWALSLQAVREEWQRVTLMQTNREDISNRYKEILIPRPIDKEWAFNVSSSFRQYFLRLADARIEFQKNISQDNFQYIANIYKNSDELPDVED